MVREFFARLLANLAHRREGPLTFRLLLQPSVAAFFAMRAGLRDARAERQPHLWAILTDPTRRRALLRESWQDVAKVFITAVVVDLVYQLIEFRWFFPEEALIVATILALLPYLLLRGPANRLARYLYRPSSTVD